MPTDPKWLKRAQGCLTSLQNAFPYPGGDVVRSCEQAIAAELERVDAELAALLPETFYADRPTTERIEAMVSAWRREHRFNRQCEEELAQLPEDFSVAETVAALTKAQAERDRRAAENAELRGMIAGLADAADSAWNLLSTTEPTSSDTLDDWKRKDKFTQGAFEILDSALTPAVRAFAEAEKAL